VQARLRESGVLGEQDQVVDGSGLSRANKVSAASLARLVAGADRDTGWGAALIASLSRGGEGTLVRRLRSPRVKNRVRAKTGFLNGVTSLAGRVVSRRGHRDAFAILIEAENTAGGRRLQDGVVNLLARGVEDLPSSAPG
jgi:D-alanyl-D-alanine carboxypeptidase/D-alanyl-D-alanine-endopeptidase (penicillin-binding protein 4)